VKNEMQNGALDNFVSDRVEISFMSRGCLPDMISGELLNFEELKQMGIRKTAFKE